MAPRKELRNAAASVRQRLLNLARARSADYQLVLMRYVGERFLYRLGASSEVDRFTLKGAAMFLVWAGTEFRATRDVDLLGMGPADHRAIRRAIDVICAVPCSEDGLVFDAAALRVEDIRDQHEYVGVRAKLRADLGGAELSLQVDIGFGDVITPSRRADEYPTLLDLPAPRVWTYPREASIAEKFEAMVRLGPKNTRIKDFWDIAVLAQHFDFDGETLRAAIEDTFRRRRTPFTPERPDALEPLFYQEPARVRLWDGFQRRARVGVVFPGRFDEVGDRVRSFLEPVRESLVRGEVFVRVWSKGGPWREGLFAGQGGVRDGAE